MDRTGDDRTGLDLSDLLAIAESQMPALADGAGLTALQGELLRAGTAAATTSLDLATIRRSAERILVLGGTVAHLTEVLLLVAPLGMHTLHEGVRELIPVLRHHAPDVLDTPLDDERRALRERYETASGYWQRLERELPGFLDGLLRLSPAGYRAFFEFCNVAWQTNALTPLEKELVYLAIDATPTHRYGPGFRLHLANVTLLGGTRLHVEETLAIAATSAEHQGVI